MKKFLLVIAVIVIAVGAGLAYVYVNLGDITKNLYRRCRIPTIGRSG